MFALFPGVPCTYLQTLRVGGSPTAADALPTGTLYHNAVLDGAVAVLVANAGGGDYRVSFTPPLTYAGGDTVQVRMTGTIGGQAFQDTSTPATVLSLSTPDDIADVVWSDEERSLTEEVRLDDTDPVVLDLKGGEGGGGEGVAAFLSMPLLVGSESDTTLTAGDTAPSRLVRLQDTNGTPINLTGCTVHYHLRLSGQSIPKIDQLATIVDALLGYVRYDWQEGDTDTPGTYRETWEVMTGSSTSQVLTFPSASCTLVKILTA